MKKPNRKVVAATVALLVGAACAAAGPPVKTEKQGQSPFHVLMKKQTGDS